ncbi:uncharacterized protein LOC121776151 [Salvia splendens]|uniref:uncharacterized protein LOC121776151 n=1 Tax=Salvia splendens TaxID=180675 RepID=UPI001C268CF6|nr:uncharacterized protein LOC121776151 [Salvia splendens]XP_042029228.1 uncharacterized protein LOC121776151 [Salvia splendens]
MSEDDRTVFSSQSDEIARQIAEIMSKSFAMMMPPTTIKPEDTNNPLEPPITYKIDIQHLHIGGNKLNGENYSTWAVLMQTAISGRGMVSHIIGVSPSPPRTDPTFPQWQQANHCVFTWLIYNIEPRLVNRVSKQPTAKHIWDALAVTYGSGGDKLQVYDLYTRASMVKQGNQSLEETWSTLQDLWLSIDQKQITQMKCPEDIKIHDQFIQELRLYQFLIAIDSKYETTKREIVKMEPLSSVDQAYNLVQREETRSQVLQPNNSNNGVTSDGVGSGLAVRGRQNQPTGWVPNGGRGGGGSGGGIGWNRRNDGENKSRLVCSYCKKKNTPKSRVSS